ERPQARRDRSEPEDPRRSRGARSRGVYGTRRTGAHRVKRSVSTRYSNTAAARRSSRSAATVFGATELSDTTTAAAICHRILRNSTQIRPRDAKSEIISCFVLLYLCHSVYSVYSVAKKAPTLYLRR